MLSQESSIEASSLGDTAGPGKGDDINGASYGGSGGRYTEDYYSYASDQSEIIGNPFYECVCPSFLTSRKESFLLGSGTGKHGGGRIWLQASSIVIRGHIQANGEDGDSSGSRGAGGSGGTILSLIHI